MKNDPVTTIAFTSVLLFFALILATLEVFSDKKIGGALVFTVIFLQTGMWQVYKAFKHQQKRIDELEQKLNEQNQIQA